MIFGQNHARAEGVAAPGSPVWIPIRLNHGTLYPVLLKLEQEGAIASEWGVSENHRRARFYRITRTGRNQLDSELSQWARTTEIVARFIELGGAKA